MRLSMRGAKMNSCIAPPSVCMGEEREGESDEKWERRKEEEGWGRERGREREREKRERECVWGGGGDSLLLVVRQQGRVQIPKYLLLCIWVVVSSDESMHDYGKMPTKNTHTNRKKSVIYIIPLRELKLMLTWQSSGKLVLSIGSGQAAVEMTGTLRIGIDRQQTSI